MALLPRFREPSILALARRLSAAREGVSAVEFALVLPVMIAIYLGSIELSMAYSVKRKVTLTASSLADLVARAETVSQSEMDDIFDAAAAVMTPYDARPVAVMVTSLWIDADGQVDVLWSQGHGASAGGLAPAETVPETLHVPETGLVVAEVAYDHEPTIGYALTGTVTLTDTFYLRPRVNPTVEWES